MFDLDAMTADLSMLVACESPSGATEYLTVCRAAVAALGTRLLGDPPEEYGENLLWGSKDPKILLLGHYDTVWPVGTLARWPFTVDGTRATGPGCFDMKAGLVQTFYALSVLPSRDGISVLVTSDEEVGSPASRALIEEIAGSASAVLVTEPSVDGALKTSRKGLARYELEIIGRAAHTGLDPERGINAGIELAHQVLAVAALADPSQGTTVTPTASTAGTTTNTVPASARLAIDVRAGEPGELERVHQAVHALQPVVPGATLVVHDGPQRGPLHRSASADLYRHALEVMPSLREASVGGGSDGNLTAALGIPTLDGLGAVGGNAHAEGEWVDLPSLRERAALLHGLLLRLHVAI